MAQGTPMMGEDNGVGFLNGIDGIFMRQRIEVLEALTGC